MADWSNFQTFVRGCVIDPELEKKMHSVTDHASETVTHANQTLEEARAALKKVSDTKDLLILAGLGLIVAGFVAGSMTTKTQPEKDRT